MGRFVVALIMTILILFLMWIVGHVMSYAFGFTFTKVDFICSIACGAAFFSMYNALDLDCDERIEV